MESAAAPRTVSVVIPTRRRAAMVRAAVASVLAQTHAVLEVLVVLDGPEDAPGPEQDAASGTEMGTLSMQVGTTAQALAGLAGVRLLTLPRSVGGAEARNHGVRAARGSWIAFLDDDDLWLADKLATQFAQLDALDPSLVRQEPVLSCTVLARGPGWQTVWPRRLYRPGEPMAEYLFCRAGWGYGEALLQTSTLLMPRMLLLRIPFTPGLPKHQDWDWLLRASADPSVSIHTGARALVVFHVEGNRPSVGRAPDWRFSYRWALAQRNLFSPRALLCFLTTECAAQAERAGLGERAAFAVALARVFDRKHWPAAQDMLRLAIYLLVPQAARRRWRDGLRTVAGAYVAAGSGSRRSTGSLRRGVSEQGRSASGRL